MTNTISALPEIAEFNDTDLFVAVQHDKYICTKYGSSCIDGRCMTNMLIDYALSICNFQDTAYMMSSDFSPYEHNHDNLYNKLSIELENSSQTTYAKRQTLSSYVTLKKQIPDAKSLSIGNLFIDGMLVPIEIPLSTVCNVQRIQFTEVEPMVGALKFVALTSVSTNSALQFKSPDFDGWLYPDGSTFNLSDFALSAQLKALYGNYDNTTFTLPDLRTFLKLNGMNNKENSSAIGWHDGITPLKRHTHNVTQTQNGTTSMFIRLRMPCNPDESTSPSSGCTIHGGDGIVTISTSSNTRKWLNYNGEMTTFKGFCHKLEIPGWEDIKTDGDKTTNPKQFRYDYIETILGAIDTYNGTQFLPEFISKNTLKLGWLSGIRLNGVLNVNGSSSLQTASIPGNAVPAHTVVPVMIYVGKRRRTII